MTQLDQLPNELLHLICSFVHPSTIVAFASTCKTLYGQAPVALEQHRNYLQKYHQISGRYPHTIPRVLLDILQEPWLAWYIKHITINQHCRNWMGWSREYKDHTCQDGHCATDHHQAGLYAAEHHRLREHFRQILEDFNSDERIMILQETFVSLVYSDEEMGLLRRAVKDHTNSSNHGKAMVDLLRGDDSMIAAMLIDAAPDLRGVILPVIPAPEMYEEGVTHCVPCWKCRVVSHITPLLEENCAQSLKTDHDIHMVTNCIIDRTKRLS